MDFQAVCTIEAFYISVDLGSGILYKHKLVDLRQAFAHSSTRLPQVWEKIAQNDIGVRNAVLIIFYPMMVKDEMF